MNPAKLISTGAVAVVAILAGPALAFDGLGHYKATEAAVAALPADAPAFFRGAGPEIAGGAMDPDVFKLKSLPQLRNGEYPEHYFDLEPLKGKTPPASRYRFIELCAKEGIEPDKIGTCPYAIAEWTQRLTVAFAQYRKWPDDAGIQHKCLVYAGLLAHYAEDSCQPLHTTVDYDGRAGADGKSPHSGIHAKVDALIEKIDVQPKVLAAGLKIHPFEDLWPAILANLQHSHNLVDKTYELEKVFPSRYGSLKKDSPATAFGTDLLETAATFTADIYLTAWRDSAKADVPAWHVREHDMAARTATAASQPAGR